MRQSRRRRRRAGRVTGGSGRRGRYEDAVDAAVGDVKRDPVCVIVIVVRAVTRAAPCAGPIRRVSMMSAGAVSPPMWWANDETVHVCTLARQRWRLDPCRDFGSPRSRPRMAARALNHPRAIGPLPREDSQAYGWRSLEVMPTMGPPSLRGAMKEFAGAEAVWGS